jgi:hypothetical protein
VLKKERKLMVPMQVHHGPSNRSKVSPRKVAAVAGLAVGAGVLVCVGVFLFFPDTYINGYLKNRIIKAFRKAYPAYSMQIGNVNCNLWENRIGCDSIALTSMDSSFSCSLAGLSVSGIGWAQILWRGDIASKDLKRLVADAREMVLNFRQSQYELRCARLHVSVPDSEILAEAFEFHPLVEMINSLRGASSGEPDSGSFFLNAG